MSHRRQLKRTAKTVKKLNDAVDSDKSDFDELYGKQLLPRNTENSSDSDTPISTYIQRKQTSNAYKQKPQKPGSIEN